MTDTNEQRSGSSPVESQNKTTTSTNDNLPPITDALHSTAEKMAQISDSRPASGSSNTTPGGSVHSSNAENYDGTGQLVPRLEATLQGVLDTMHNSNFFPRIAKNPRSRFWSTHEHIAKQCDDEFLEMHNGQMNVLLIFAGLFSAMNSIFIMSMRLSLDPNPSDTTNALTMITINKMDNSTFPAQQAVLFVCTEPSSTAVWIQMLAYMSLSSSLLAAFGAVLEKQWLGHFKTSRFGKGDLYERCKRRQQKFDGLETWHFRVFISTLPILLQLSLLFFGIALATNMWAQQHTVASVVMATTALGVMFYFFTLVASLKCLDCQTPVSTMVHHSHSGIAVVGKGFCEKWTGHPKSWADSWDDLKYFSGHVLSQAKNLTNKPITSLVVYILQHLGVLRQHLRLLVRTEAEQHLGQSRATARVQTGLAPDELAHLEKGVLEASGGVLTGSSVDREQSLNLDPELAGGWEHSGNTDNAGAMEEQTMWHFAFLEPHIEAQRAQDSVLSNTIWWTLEKTMDTDIIATAASMIQEVECPDEDNITNVLEQLKGHFYACFQPTGHILVLLQGQVVVCLKAIYHIYIKRQLPFPFYIFKDGCIQSTDNDRWYFMQPNQDFLIVWCAIAWESPIELNIASLSTPDHMWMAHVFAYHLNRGSVDPKFGGRLLDKSKGIGILAESVINHVLGVLLGGIPGCGWQPCALKLLPSILQHCVKQRIYFMDHCTNKRCIKYCFHLLEEASGTEADSEDKVQFKTVASLIHHFRCLTCWEPHNWYTQKEFDLLVDYHLQICQGTDYDMITDTFDMLSVLCGSPSTQDRMHRYVDTVIQFMCKNLWNFYPALLVACQVRKDVASIGRDDATFCKDFSMQLAAVLTDSTHPVPHDMNPFRDTSLLSWWRDIPYLYLLSTLSQNVTWQPYLRQSGHFDNCVVIADTMSYTKDELWDGYAVPVAHIFANIDASGVHTPVWPLILRAWRYIFNLKFFGGAIEDAQSHLPSNKDSLEALPIITAFARRRGDDKKEALIKLVEQVCNKLDEERQFREQGEVQGIQEQTSVGSPDICDLGKKIRRLLNVEGSG